MKNKYDANNIPLDSISNAKPEEVERTLCVNRRFNLPFSPEHIEKIYVGNVYVELPHPETLERTVNFTSIEMHVVLTEEGAKKYKEIVASS